MYATIEKPTSKALGEIVIPSMGDPNMREADILFTNLVHALGKKNLSPHRIELDDGEIELIAVDRKNRSKVVLWPNSFTIHYSQKGGDYTLSGVDIQQWEAKHIKDYLISRAP